MGGSCTGSLASKVSLPGHRAVRCVLPDEIFTTADFERRVALRARTQAVARHLTDFLEKTDRFAKTIVFCVDQEHASEMRAALNNLNADLVGGPVAQASSPADSGGVSPLRRGTPTGTVGGLPAETAALPGYADYVCRVTADEGDIGRGHIQRFQDVESRTPVILTTSQLLTTGLDAPTCRNIVLVRLINSMVEFKQIIGRGTRVRDDYGKLTFNILDYTGTAMRKDKARTGDLGWLPTFLWINLPEIQRGSRNPTRRRGSARWQEIQARQVAFFSAFMPSTSALL